jgi:hypothetical protein
MPSATLIGAAVAVLVVICSIVAIAVNFSQNAAQAAILLIPDAYTAGFHVEWTDMATLLPTGYTTEGVLSVNHGVTSFVVNSVFNNTSQMLTTYTDGLLYGNAECIGATDSGLLDMSNVKQPDVAKSIEPERADPVNCANGFLYSINAFYANHLLCIKDRVLQWVSGDAYTLTVTSFLTRSTPILPPPNAHMSRCYI